MPDPDESSLIVHAPRRPTITDVAALAGTSKGTVSFVLNDRPGVAPATRDRILSAIRELGYQPSQVARSLSNSRSDAIGLVLARSPQTLRSDSFFAPFIAGVELGIAHADSSVLLRFVSGEEEERVVYRRLAQGRRVDGVILADLRRDDTRIGLLRELGLPAVTLNSPDIDSPFLAVRNDDVSGIVAAVEHLVALGHRRIAHVSGPTSYLHSLQRGLAWRRALREYGIELGPAVAGDFTAEGGAHATRSLLALPHADRPTAIVFDNDTMAVSGMVAAQGMGLDVPSDLSVVGFDDAELAAYVHPPLTTIRTDPFAWGESAARALLGVVNGTSTVRTVEVGTSELVVRGSTAPAPA